MTLNEQRDRLLRVMAGAILANSADTDELRFYCSMLANDLQIGGGIADLLAPMIEPRKGNRFSKAMNPIPGPVKLSADELLAAWLQLGISKRQGLDAMRKANSRFAEPPSFGKMAVKDLIRKFVHASSPEQVSRLLSFLSPEEIDPYLRGIGRGR